MAGTATAITGGIRATATATGNEERGRPGPLGRPLRTDGQGPRGCATMILLDDPSACAVFLDLDGTLIDIAAAPDLVHIPSDLVPLLARLSSGLRGALAIVTGRPIGDVNRFLDPLRLVTAGVHGAQLRTEMNGEVLLTVGPMDPDVASAVGRLSDLAPGVVIERRCTQWPFTTGWRRQWNRRSRPRCKASSLAAQTISFCALAVASLR